MNHLQLKKNLLQTKLLNNLKINFRAKRRSPYAEISGWRTRFEELTGEMFIEACYEYDIRVVVNTERLFAKHDTYNVFLAFLEENYVLIIEGYILRKSNTPTSEWIPLSGSITNPPFNSSFFLLFLFATSSGSGLHGSM